MECLLAASKIKRLFALKIAFRYGNIYTCCLYEGWAKEHNGYIMSMILDTKKPLLRSQQCLRFYISFIMKLSPEHPGKEAIFLVSGTVFVAHFFELRSVSVIDFSF